MTPLETTIALALLAAIVGIGLRDALRFRASWRGLDEEE